MNLTNQPTLALPLPHTETFADWSNLGRRLCASARTINWLIGDWLIDGSDRFGEKARNEANQIFRSDVERFSPIVDTCRRFTEPRRHTALTFGHHLAVMPVTDDAQADELLTRAETARMTTAALKAEVKLAFHHPRLIEDDDPDDTAYRAIIQASNRAPASMRRMAVESIIEAEYGVVDL